MLLKIMGGARAHKLLVYRFLAIQVIIELIRALNNWDLELSVPLRIKSVMIFKIIDLIIILEAMDPNLKNLKIALLEKIIHWSRSKVTA